MAIFNQIRYSLICLLLITALSNQTAAQLIDVSSDIVLPTDHTGGFVGSGVSFVDFNQDGFDDLSFGHHEGQIKFFTGTGNSFQEIDLGISNNGYESKGLCWIDFDNDGDLDLFVTNRLAPNKVWRNDNGNYTDISSSCGIDQGLSKSFGMSFGDYDNDGFLDFYICNYQLWVDTGFENELYHNNGDGTFTEVTQQAGVGNGLKQSFQASWVDINDDGFLDLHVANDRHEFENPFFINNGDGTFTDQSQTLGTNIAALAMCSSFEDFDRDGDQDIFVSNGIDGNFLLENKLNETGHFENNANLYGVEMFDYCWAGEWIDYNSDSWPDLHVSFGYTTFTEYPEILESMPPSEDAFFINTGMPPFEDGSSEISNFPQHTFSVASGDFNNDGMPDLVSHRVGETAAIYKGVLSTNNWVKVKLTGVASNKHGIGCSIAVNRLLFNGQTQTQHKVIFSGDNYLGQDSYWQHFGLGSSTEIESIIVKWSNGEEVTYGPFNANQHLILEEPPSIIGCTYPGACNYNSSAVEEDGTCNFSCICGENTVWDYELELCKPVPSCPTDLNYDGATEIEDFLIMLSAFGLGC